ncbi:MAG: chorismate mutase [Candidatus Gastranaerophilales bacterium]|nr:chorismate mutase [Candidatus Gastranaerophilales bacterium]
MMTRGIRGAITVDENTPEDISKATITLLTELLIKNQVKNEDISHVVFTLTKDLDAAFPAKFARESLNWDFIPMVCFNELKVEGSLKKCLRVLVVANTDKNQKDIFHVYLKGAKVLRPDLS